MNTTSVSPLVSICLLTWNRANVLHRSLDTLLAQDYPNFELIINDDCSSDHTAEVCRYYEAKNSRVRYCRNETNLKYSGNSNAAVDRSLGEYILFAHDGDVYDSRLISTWVQLMETHPTAAIAFSALNVMDQSGSVIKTLVEDYANFITGKTLLRYMLLRFDSPIFGITLVRKKCLEICGKFDEQFPRITDVDMWMRLLARFDAVYSKVPLINIMPREEGHENNSGVNWKIVKQLVGIRAINIQRFLAEHPADRQLLVGNFHRDCRKLILHNLAWCIRHGRMRIAYEGFRRLLACEFKYDFK